MLQLYTYARSVSAFRVRIALNYKSLPYEMVYVDVEGRGEHQSEAYLRLNPQGLIPALVVSDDLVISQSAAIMEFLEECYPERALLPALPEDRARVRSFAHAAISDIQPLNMLRVYRYLRDEFQLSWEQRRKWYEDWMPRGLSALESALTDGVFEGGYCFGTRPTMADVCVVPQMYNAQQYHLDVSAYPRLRQVYRTCMTLSAFQSAAPEAQSDNPASLLASA